MSKTPQELQDLVNRITNRMIDEFKDELTGMDWSIFISEIEKKDFMAISSNECVVCLAHTLQMICEVYGLDHLEVRSLTASNFSVMPSKRVN